MKRSPSKLLISLICVIVCTVLSGPAFADGAPRGIALSFTGDTSSTVTAAWSVDGNSKQEMQVVRESEFDINGFVNALVFPSEAKDISLDGSGAWRCEATAYGLVPDTAYVYRVGCEGHWSGALTFSTPQAQSDTLTFAYFGDIQTNVNSESEYDAWGKMAADMYKSVPELAFAVLGGDIVDNGISTSLFDSFFGSAEPVFSCVPLLAANGNHESNFIGGKPELYLDYFALPQNGPDGFKEEFYSFDYANCHILVLNSWVFSGEQNLSDADYERVNDWIAADLARSDADWQIVVTHVPIYAVHSDTTASAAKENWAPIFEKYGVDLVFEGHQHVYSRSYPMYEGKIDYENGITYIMGVSGSKFYDSADETLAERTIYSTSNYQLVRADGNTLTVQSVDAAGNELDYVSIAARSVAVTRGEFIKALWNGEGSPTDAQVSPFYDTDAEYAAWAYENGILLGYGNGMAGLDDVLSDWQRCLILERLENVT